MDRRSLLKMFGVAAAAAAVIHPTVGDAMPMTPRADVNPTLGESAVATEEDLEKAKAEKAYWVIYRRRFRRRYFVRRYRYRVYRRRYFFRRRRWW